MGDYEGAKNTCKRMYDAKVPPEMVRFHEARLMLAASARPRRASSPGRRLSIRRSAETRSVRSRSRSVLMNTTPTGAPTPTFAPKIDFTAGMNPADVAASIVRSLQGNKTETWIGGDQSLDACRSDRREPGLDQARRPGLGGPPQDAGEQTAPEESGEARYEDGVLKLMLPKKEEAKKTVISKHIAVK